jgi:cytoskeleton protein RodZ
LGAFGERLRREREMRGVSLEEIASVTKIGTRLLRALEEENFDQLPGGIFNKSYVRAYCKCVGLDEEKGVADYLEASGETAPDVRVIARQNASARADRPISSGGSFPVVPVLVLLVAAAGATGGWHILQERRHDQEQKLSPSNSVTNATSPVQRNSTGGSAPPETSQLPKNVSPQSRNAAQELAATSSAKGTTASFATPTPSSITATRPMTAGEFEVTVRAKDRAWVSLQSDGKIMVRGIIKAPDAKTVRASNEVVLWTGNAGATEVSFNGKDVPLHGGTNEEQMLVFNSHGLQPSPAHP